MPEFLDLHSSTTKSLRAVTEAAMQRHGLHLGQDHLLRLLWERDGRTPGEIAAAAHVTTPAVVKMAGRMVEAGLIARRQDAQDGRLVRLWLTEAGRALQEPVTRARQAVEDRLTAELTAHEREVLVTALTKISRSADALLNER